VDGCRHDSFIHALWLLAWISLFLAESPKGGPMKKFAAMALSGALTFAVASFASAETIERKTTETETTFKGTVSEFAPGSSTLIIKGEAGEPSRYSVTNRTTFVDSEGNTVTRESISNQPVTVYYSKAGDTMTVDKVVVTRPGGRTTRETTTERRTTTE
jgi:hypothetical protein